MFPFQRFLTEKTQWLIAKGCLLDSKINKILQYLNPVSEIKLGHLKIHSECNFKKKKIDKISKLSKNYYRSENCLIESK